MGKHMTIMWTRDDADAAIKVTSRYVGDRDEAITVSAADAMVWLLEGGTVTVEGVTYTLKEVSDGAALPLLG